MGQFLYHFWEYSSSGGVGSLEYSVMEYNLGTLHFEIDHPDCALYVSFLPWDVWSISDGKYVPLTGLQTWSIV